MKIRISEIIKEARKYKTIEAFIKFLESRNCVSVYEASVRIGTSYRVLKRVIKQNNIKTFGFTNIYIYEKDLFLLDEIVKKNRWKREDL